MSDQTDWKRVKIAEACGWTDISDWKAAGINGKHPTGPWTEVIPDYFQCLNAMHDAENILTNYQHNLFCEWLVSISNPYRYYISATASMRAEAFGLTLGLWQPGQTEPKKESE